MCAALAAGTLALGIAARAQQSEDQRLCSASTGVSREQRLERCTALIEARPARPQDSFANQTLATAFNNRGAVYLDLRDYDRAIADYDRAITIYDETIRDNPNDTSAYLARAKAYGLRENIDRAIADLNEAIRLDPNLATAYYLRGVIEQVQGDVGGGDADILKARQIDPAAFAKR